MLTITLAVIVLSAIFFQLFVSPFSKVEESFNLHALYDFIHQPSWSSIAYHGDHVNFPGPIPRTFIGSILIGSIASPLIFIAKSFGAIHSKFGEQIICRSILALINGSSIIYFGLCSRMLFGNQQMIFSLLLSSIQFHLMFYSSRTLPNMFAFPLVQIGLGQYMITMRRSQSILTRKRRTLRAFSLLTFGALVFRLEVIGILLPIVFHSLLSRRLTFWEMIKRGFLASFASLELTIPIDSYFWQKLTWPEGASVFFNVIEGKSQQWGVMPWHFYFTSSLPKLLGLSYPFAILGFTMNRKIFVLGLFSLIFISLMSYLGHKETRFIIYIVPIWNLATAICLNKLSSMFCSWKSVKLALWLIIGGSTLTSTVISTYLSAYNYPGGKAILDLHSIEVLKPHELRIHLDDLVAQSGASRFLQLRDKDGLRKYPSIAHLEWTYDKLENLTAIDVGQKFDVIVSESKEIEGFRALQHIWAFDRIKLKPLIYLKKTLQGVLEHPEQILKLGKDLIPLSIQFDPQKVTIFINQQKL